MSKPTQIECRSWNNNYRLAAAEHPDGTQYGIGGRICECCGSQTVTDLKIDGANRGITFELSDKKSDLKDSRDFKVQSFEIDGVWFNFKLNQHA